MLRWMRGGKHRQLPVVGERRVSAADFPQGPSDLRHRKRVHLTLARRREGGAGRAAGLRLRQASHQSCHHVAAMYDDRVGRYITRVLPRTRSRGGIRASCLRNARGRSGTQPPSDSTGASSRNARTAATRRYVSASCAKSSFVKSELMCLSTADSDSERVRAMPGLDLPFAISLGSVSPVTPRVRFACRRCSGRRRPGIGRRWRGWPASRCSGQERSHRVGDRPEPRRSVE